MRLTTLAAFGLATLALAPVTTTACGNAKAPATVQPATPPESASPAPSEAGSEGATPKPTATAPEARRATGEATVLLMSDIRGVLRLLGKMQANADVVLGLNLSESTQALEVLGLEVPANPEAAIESTAAAIEILSVARKLERIGDLCTNIAEEVIFLVEGQIVRHEKV